MAATMTARALSLLVPAVPAVLLLSAAAVTGIQHGPGEGPAFAASLLGGGLLALLTLVLAAEMLRQHWWGRG